MPPSRSRTILTLVAGCRHKGLLVEIGYDPHSTTDERLRAWERGYLGEIFS